MSRSSARHRVAFYAATALLLAACATGLHAQDRPVVETQDLSSFDHFEFEAGFEKPDDLADQIEISIDEDFVPIVRVAFRVPDPDNDICADRVCTIPLPDRILTGAEEAIVEQVFGFVNYGNFWEGWCAAAFIAPPHRFRWDGFQLSAHICLPPTLTEESELELLEVVARLQRGSEDCNENGTPDAHDISGGVSGDEDEDGLPDECDAPASPTPFHRGDANDDGNLSLADAIFLLGSLFLGTGAPACEDAADADNSSNVDLADPISILNHLFLGGPEPPRPGPPGLDCGPDPEAVFGGNLGCDRYESC